MITTLADVLRALQDAEAKRLQAQGITHGPTIGAMYEGLTKDILERAVPPGLDLKVVSGFIEGAEGSPLSSQMDLMLVRGEGRQIPYTDNYIWPVEDVLVVFEVKKTLSGTELLDAVTKMWMVTNLAQEYKRAGGYSDREIAFACKIFAKLTGYNLPVSDIHLLPTPLQIIFSAMVRESLYPVRVIWGYDGYRTEEGLRQGAERLFFGQGESVGSKGFLSFPSLVTCGSLSLVKLNGFPYFNPHADFQDTWDVMGSSSENPTKILLEQVWTKISSEANLRLPLDDTLHQEALALLFRFEYVDKMVNGQRIYGFEGRSFANFPMNKKAADTPSTWSPEAGDDLQVRVLLEAVEIGFLDLNDDWFKELCAQYGANPEDVLLKFVRHRTMAWVNAERTRAEPIEPENRIVLMPDGSVAISDNPYLLDLWIREKGRG
jgi:hypothetical protein